MDKTSLKELSLVNMNSPKKELKLIRKYDEDEAWSAWHAMLLIFQRNYGVFGEGFSMQIAPDAFIHTGEYIKSPYCSWVYYEKLIRNNKRYDVFSRFIEKPNVNSAGVYKPPQDSKEEREEDKYWLKDPEQLLDASQVLGTILWNPGCVNSFQSYRLIGRSFKAAVGKEDIGSAYKYEESEYDKLVEDCFNNLTGTEQLLVLLHFIQVVFDSANAKSKTEKERYGYGVEFAVGEEDDDEVTNLIDNAEAPETQLTRQLNEKNMTSNPFGTKPVVKVNGRMRDPNYIDEEEDLEADWEVIMPYGKKDELLDSFDDTYDRAVKIGKSKGFRNCALALREFIDNAYNEKEKFSFKAGTFFAEAGKKYRYDQCVEVMNWFKDALIARYKFNGNQDVRFEEMKFNQLSAKENIDIVLGICRDVKRVCNKTELEYVYCGMDILIKYIKGGMKPLSWMEIAHRMYNETPYGRRDSENERESYSKKAVDILKEELQYEYELVYERKFDKTSPVTFLESIDHGGYTRPSNPSKKKLSRFLTIDDPSWAEPFGN